MSSFATGPRTVEGKERASRNATKHGLRSERPVLPGEDPAEWDEFHRQIVADLDPGSFLEKELADRVALQMWRLRRAARYEVEAAEDGIENVRKETLLQVGYLEPEEPISRVLLQQVNAIEEQMQALAQLEAGRELVRELATATTNAPVELPTVVALMALLGITSADELPQPASAGAVRRALADWSGRSAPEALKWAAGIAAEKCQMMAERLEGMRARQKALQADLQSHIEAQQRDRCLPPKPALDRVVRYEAHVSRQLNQALQLLRQFKAERLAKAAAPSPAPAPVVAPIREEVAAPVEYETATRAAAASSIGNSEVTPVVVAAPREQREAAPVLTPLAAADGVRLVDGPAPARAVLEGAAIVSGKGTTGPLG